MAAKCSRCGRFMKLGGYYTNDHDDSWEDAWRCMTPHAAPVLAIEDPDTP